MPAEQHRARQAAGGGPIGEDTHDAGAATDPRLQSFLPTDSIFCAGQLRVSCIGPCLNPNDGDISNGNRQAIYLVPPAATPVLGSDASAISEDIVQATDVPFSCPDYWLFWNPDGGRHHLSF